ncbi:pyrimidine 5'-nucleotidase [Vibrio profundum]|uniref:pyrimidine 5'-nucleotidase n=1 Tax=Vibrio profundum TaxID=2910247 RepID=UPI003D0A83C6
MNYEWVLFDADETLFHFDAFQGMQLMFERKGVEFLQEDYQEYQRLNKPLWDDYQNGDITAAQIKHIRFQSWAEKLGTTTQELNNAFLQAMADICSMLPGAKELLDSLVGKVKLGIITNGFTELQAIRLEKMGLSEYFEHVVISEQVGVAKPDVKIFDYAMQKMGTADKSRVLMVGDNLLSDIKGGIGFGIDTCWLNSQAQGNPTELQPTFTVNTLSELQRLLG